MVLCHLMPCLWIGSYFAQALFLAPGSHASRSLPQCMVFDAITHYGTALVSISPFQAFQAHLKGWLLGK
jgi:hypothetical protein